MANISGLLGTAGGARGTGISAPTDAVSQAQLAAAQQQVVTNQANQTDLLSSLQGQNGLSNQSSVYNQMQGVANGTGPNPAQAQLAQATGANISSQAALMAGQRGSGTNAGLIARQAAQQGAQTQQQAAGQAATLQANQSMNALNQMGSIANTQVSNQIGQTNANMGAAQATQNAFLNTTANQNALRNQQIQSVAQEGASFFNPMAGGAANSGGSMLSAGAEGGRAGDLPKLAAGGNIGKVLPLLALMADGGDVVDQSSYQGASKFGQFLSTQAAGLVDPGELQTWGNPKEKQGNGSSAKKSPTKGGTADPNTAKDTSAPTGDTASDVATPTSDTVDAVSDVAAPAAESVVDDAAGALLAEGGKVPAMVSPGEIRIHAKDVPKVARGQKSPLDGEHIPGKPKVAGAKNSYANDFVPKTLNAGDIILPRSVTQSKDPAAAAHKFVGAIMAKNGKSMPKRSK